MSNTNTGGPAFPMTGMDFRNGQQVEAVHQRGMTLRDYFAAKAMQAHIAASWVALGKAHATNTDAINPIIAMAAYETADAMLKARET
jgi:hypothetical protein